MGGCEPELAGKPPRSSSDTHDSKNLGDVGTVAVPVGRLQPSAGDREASAATGAVQVGSTTRNRAEFQVAGLSHQSDALRVNPIKVMYEHGQVEHGPMVGGRARDFGRHRGQGVGSADRVVVGVGRVRVRSSPCPVL